MRDLSDVVNKMLEKIPERKIDLIHEFDRLLNDMRYVAPERMHEVWHEVSYILGYEIPHEPREQWEIDVVNIFADKNQEERVPLMMENHDGTFTEYGTLAKKDAEALAELYKDAPRVTKEDLEILRKRNQEIL
jgi:hypothetical protein